MDLPTFLLLLVTFSALFAAIMYVLYVSVHDETKNRMNDLVNHYLNVRKNETPTTELPYCPKGCERGDCKNPDLCFDFYHPNPDCCKFDLQCRNCVDRTTGNVYYNEGGDTDFINNNYNSRDPETIAKLNKEIRRQNKYIKEVNQLVSEHNKPFFDQQLTDSEAITSTK